jgi:hypothetical protein
MAHLLESIRAANDAGFTAIASRVREKAIPGRDSHRLLADLIRFREEEVGWAELDGLAIRSLVNGTPAAWMAVIPPDHSLATEQRMSYEATLDFGPFLLLIKPVLFTEEWAGLAQLHEATHLYDWARGIEPFNATQRRWARGEVRAHGVELEIFDLLTEGQYAVQARHFAGNHGIDSPERLLELLARGNGKLAQLAELSTIFSSARPRSHDEVGFRYGTHIAALGLLLLSQWGRVEPEHAQEESFILSMVRIGGHSI